jgi:hypothetical protein
MTKQLSDCVLLADRHHGLSEGIRGLLETSFNSVFPVADETSLIEGGSSSEGAATQCPRRTYSGFRGALDWGYSGWPLYMNVEIGNR